MKHFLTLILLLAAAIANASTADHNPAVNEKPLVAASLESFTKTSTAIHDQMQTGGIYENISGSDRQRVEEKMASMRTILQQHSDQNALSPSDQVSLFNAQEEVNGILRHNDNNRLVCERGASTGTLVPSTTCQTFGALSARRRDDQQHISNLMTPVKIPTAPSGH